MKSLIDHLSTYATYHRDRRNIATHFVGVPMIVFGVQALLSRPGLAADGLVTPALIATIGTLLFYARMSPRFALIMAALLVPSLYGANQVAAQSTQTWLVASLGVFTVGWVIQFVGHIFEGKKPAFVDDLIGLLVGPLFVVAEVGFALGLASNLEERVEERAGPTHSGQQDDHAQPHLS
jgi:uncharacterized membrane protein YGL010W